MLIFLLILAVLGNLGLFIFTQVAHTPRSTGRTRVQWTVTQGERPTTWSI